MTDTNAYAGYPVLTGQPVQQGHLTYCAANGHAAHITDGIVDTFCPRCGEDVSSLLADEDSATQSTPEPVSFIALAIPASGADQNTLNSHTFRCASHAEWNAYENLTDAHMASARESVQREAARYLSEGIVSCICAQSNRTRYVSPVITTENA